MNNATNRKIVTKASDTKWDRIQAMALAILFGFVVTIYALKQRGKLSTSNFSQLLLNIWCVESLPLKVLVK
jgi:hypothetical protein